MKTTIITIATICSLAFGSVNAATTDKFDDSAATVLNDVKNINKIEVRGNVELYVSNSVNDRVKVYNRYYTESALVQNNNGVLRISSYSAKKLVVWVSANDLRSITAFDNATIKSFGTLSAINLNVTLNNKATAQLNIDSYSADIKVNDNAKADLTGSVNDYAINYGGSTSVNYGKLVAMGKGQVAKNVEKYTMAKNELAAL
ncbi:GIN domain-containing protein [Mucilaginibacter defluvii]|uniref:Putative auto-transporter adhesin head GIN domain-containing protein n=1 Tax=Mucilaginibacter defluvii TaxID=1196019 RepID=A0ABP9FNV6_9SPHI